eukprot:NODE_2434_length_1065_cov_36.857143_g2416_i0.p1 GENE.NODE_2434_length_1065_cov_36.857143_g2416_i0~~NODE_2434_length_1065_cov_36.857143_g2416_i0.p1  ORF type:complete len:123 (-),score=15.01 NODE_2434_length_1065_cov_36.857143_g2416_i0:332-700(-)
MAMWVLPETAALLGKMLLSPTIRDDPRARTHNTQRRQQGYDASHLVKGVSNRGAGLAGDANIATATIKGILCNYERARMHGQHVAADKRNNGDGLEVVGFIGNNRSAASGIHHATRQCTTKE